MSAWWPCSICELTIACSHREPELVEWVRAGEATAELIEQAIERKPAAGTVGESASGRRMREAA